MITLLLFAQLINQVIPVWKDTPIPHWHCPSGYVLMVPHPVPLCRPFAPVDKLYGFDGSKQEFVRWGEVKIVPPSGKLRVYFRTELTGQPGCEVIDKSDSENSTHFGPVTKEGFMIYSKPGHKLHLNCTGILPR
jgi:hypothetical protein